MAWKLFVPPEAREVSYRGHRADIVGRHGKVLELQHSNISPSTVHRREDAHGDMIWIFDSAPFAKSLFLETAEPSSQREGSFAWCGIRWSRPWKAFRVAQRPIYLDLDPILPGALFRMDPMKSSWSRNPLGGWLYTPDVLVDWWLYPEYRSSAQTLGFQRVRILAGKRPVGRELKKYVARRKGAAAWVTDDSLVQWNKFCDVTTDLFDAAQKLVANQDVLVLVPRSVSNSTAKLDGFQPPAMAQAEKTNKKIYFWWEGQWFCPTESLVWEPDAYEMEDWGLNCENSEDNLLRGLVRVRSWGWQP